MTLPDHIETEGKRHLVHMMSLKKHKEEILILTSPAWCCCGWAVLVNLSIYCHLQTIWGRPWWNPCPVSLKHSSQQNLEQLLLLFNQRWNKLPELVTLSQFLSNTAAAELNAVYRATLSLFLFCRRMFLKSYSWWKERRKHMKMCTRFQNDVQTRKWTWGEGLNYLNGKEKQECNNNRQKCAKQANQ